LACLDCAENETPSGEAGMSTTASPVATLAPCEDLPRLATCHHGTPIVASCASCEAEGYVRCPLCLRLFVPEDHRERYCTVTCRGKAAHKRQVARERADYLRNKRGKR
jgi:hypothetical protein